MALRDGFNALVQGVAEKAVQLMSDKYTDNDKAGIALSMALDVKDGMEACFKAIDKLTETNEQLLAQNKELLSSLNTIQNQNTVMNANVLSMVYGPKKYYNNKKSS